MGELSVVGADGRPEGSAAAGFPQGSAPAGFPQGSGAVLDPTAALGRSGLDVEQDATWARGGVAPVVVGDNGGSASRRDYGAPFPEAGVLFGLPDVRAGSGGGRDESTKTARHAFRPSASPGPSEAPKSTEESGYSEAPRSSETPGHSEPSGSLGATVPLAASPAPVQARGHKPDDRAVTGAWFDGEHDGAN